MRFLRRLDSRTAARLSAIRSRARGLCKCGERPTVMVAALSMAQIVEWRL